MTENKRLDETKKEKTGRRRRLRLLNRFRRKRPFSKRMVALTSTLGLSAALLLAIVIGAMAAEPATTSFNQTWQRTDDPVAFGLVDRTWMWGPEGFTDAMTEPYTESPGRERTVQYFDKSRMEDNSFRGTTPWDVTNGLLVVELITGRMQIGDNDFEQRLPAAVNVAGDADDPSGVQYATLAALLNEPALSDDAAITQRLDQFGNVSDDASLASLGVTAAYRVTEPGIDHQVASPFWEFMNSEGAVYEGGSYIDAPMFLSPFYATGYPITEAYWANVKVAGTYQDVLLQCFERRCLTFTPGNDPGWQVEAGNVGQHYYQWRYGQSPNDQLTQEPNPSSTAAPPTGTPPATGTQPVDPSPIEPTATGTLPANPTASPTATIQPSPSPTATEDLVLDYDFAGEFGGPYDPDSPFDGLGAIAIGKDGSVYIAEPGEKRVQKYTAKGEFITLWDGYGANGAGPDEFDDLKGIAVDANGNVWVTDADANRILKFDSDGNYLDHFGEAGSGNRQFQGPHGIAVDKDGFIYIVDQGNNRIQKLDSDGKYVDKWGGPGATAGLFSSPWDIAVDSNNILYVTDSGNDRVQKFTTDGNPIGEWDGAGSPKSQLDGPHGIAINERGVVYITDPGNQRIQSYDTNGSFFEVWNQTTVGLDHPIYSDGIVVYGGSVYITDYLYDVVTRLDARGNYRDSWVDGRRGRFTLGAIAMTLDPSGNVYVSDFGRIQKFDANGNFQHEIGAEAGPGDLDSPYALDVGPYGYLYAADFDRNAVTVFTQDGEYVGEWNGNVRPGGELDGPVGLALDDDGYVYVLEILNHRIQKFQPDGDFEAEWDLTGIAETPLDIAISDDRLYLLDAGAGFAITGSPLPIVTPGTNPSVKVFDLVGGTLLGEFDGGGQLIAPYGIGIEANGDVYVTDVGTNTVLKFKPNGDFLTSIGEPGGGNGQFAFPTDVKIAPDGTVYVLDTLNYRVQVFEAS